MSQQSQIIQLQGGLDLVTPAMAIKPGFVIAAENYEPQAKGYARCDGYERLDGRTPPSEATYLILQFTQGTATITADQTVTGLTSGASGIAMVDMEVTGGTLAGGDALGRLTLRAVTGTFADTEFLQVAGVSKARASGSGETNAASTDALHASYLATVVANARSAIQPVPGSGPVRGVVTYKGAVYAWRDNAGATACVMHKATTAGWVEQALGWRLPFNDGDAEILEGDTLYGGVSGATAVVKRVARTTGTWGALAAADRAAGHLILASVSGTFSASEPIASSSGGTAQSNGAITTQVLPAGATIRCHIENFYATQAFERLYFVTVTGRAYEWDGETLAPIYTGLTDALDKPTHVGSHKGHLFLAFPGGSLQGSSTGEPLTFEAITGAVEIGFGQEVTGLVSDIRDSLVVLGANKIAYLVGFDYQDFDLKVVTTSSGAIAGTVQTLSEPVFLDDLGLRQLSAAETYGDWSMATLSYRVEPLLRAKRAAGVMPLGSVRVRGRDQYRIYFSDLTGLVMYVGRKEPEILPVSLGFTPTCFHSGEKAAGQEILLAGGSDGYVYQLDAGTSFDGAVLPAYLRTSFVHQGAPGAMKRYHSVWVEGSAGANDASLFVAADFSYADGDAPGAPESGFTFPGQGGFWGSAVWNEFFWSSPVQGQVRVDLDGIGENISLVFGSETTTEKPHTLSSLKINYAPRRSIR